MSRNKRKKEIKLGKSINSNNTKAIKVGSKTIGFVKPAKGVIEISIGLSIEANMPYLIELFGDNLDNLKIIAKPKVVKAKRTKVAGKTKKHFYFNNKLSYKENYYLYLKTSLWKSKRKQVLKRDKKTCQDCGEKKKLQVHHLHYKNVFNENIKDLITLCKKCHEIRHNI